MSFLHNTDSSLLRTAKYKALKTLLALPLPRGYRFNMVTVFTRISATQMKRRPRIGSCFYIRGFLTKARLPADVSYFFYGARTTPWREMWIPEYRKFLLVESGIWEFFCGILGFGIWNTIQGIRNPTNAWNPESRQVPLTRRIQNSCRGIHNPRLDSLTLGKN